MSLKKFQPSFTQWLLFLQCLQVLLLQFVYWQPAVKR